MWALASREQGRGEDGKRKEEATKERKKEARTISSFDRRTRQKEGRSEKGEKWKRSVESSLTVTLTLFEGIGEICSPLFSLS